MRIILEAVSKASPRGILGSRLVDKLYADREDGGPENALGVVHQQVLRLNKTLKQDGLAVRAGRWSDGYRLLRL